MIRHNIEIGEEGDTILPASEVCMHMRVAHKLMHFKLLSQSMVQLITDNGQNFSFPITTGEAGVYNDGNRFYYYR